MSQARGSAQKSVDETETPSAAAQRSIFEDKDAKGSGDIVGLASDVATEIAGAAVDQGRALYESARGQATSFADQRKEGAAQSIADIASSLRESGKTFDDRPNIQGFVASAADGLEQLADSLRERSFADLYADAEDYARRQPMTVGAVAVVAGFLLARFIKSSADDLSEAGAARRASGHGRPSRPAGRPAAAPRDA